MSLKRPVTIAQARQWPAAAARRKSFCARMGGMRDKLTSDRVAMDPRSKINRALAAWDCDVPELLDRKHVKKGIRPMKITSKMVGAEARKARKNPIGRQETYALAEENLANLKKRYQAVLLTMADLRDNLKRRKKGLPDDDMRGYTDAEISKLIKNYQTRAQDLRAAIAQYESGNWWKNPRKPAARKNPARAKMARIMVTDDKTGEKRVETVPYDFAIKAYIGPVQHDFFVRSEGATLVVSEKSTGLRVGAVPYMKRYATMNDRESAKAFLADTVARVGADKFRAAIVKAPKIA